MLRPYRAKKEIKSRAIAYLQAKKANDVIGIVNDKAYTLAEFIDHQMYLDGEFMFIAASKPYTIKLSETKDIIVCNSKGLALGYMNFDKTEWCIN